jgi:hypothetical protein
MGTDIAILTNRFTRLTIDSSLATDVVTLLEINERAKEDCIARCKQLLLAVPASARRSLLERYQMIAIELEFGFLARVSQSMSTASIQLGIISRSAIHASLSELPRFLGASTTACADVASFLDSCSFNLSSF